MNTPHRQDADEFVRELEQCRRRAVCLSCAGLLSSRTAYISVHSNEFRDQCAGEGRCFPFMIPYCSHCEPEPEMYGCIHMKLFDLLTQQLTRPTRFKRLKGWFTRLWHS